MSIHSPSFQFVPAATPLILLSSPLPTHRSPVTALPLVRPLAPSPSLSFPLTPTSLDRLITAKDHASIQIQIADVDADGKAIKGRASTIAICGRIRAQGDSDDSINRIATKEGRESHSPFGSVQC